jgi:uncharacterized membrane protein YraQ (UPF0718 family)
MSIETYVIYGIAIILLVVSFIFDKGKTKKGILKGIKSFIKLFPILIPLLLIIGILLAVISPDLISSYLGESSGIIGYAFALIVGSITFLPSFVAFPLGAELIEAGAGLPQVAGFLVALMSVGIIYYAAETKYFSKKAAIYRNVISLIGAIIVILVAMVMY